MHLVQKQVNREIGVRNLSTCIMVKNWLYYWEADGNRLLNIEKAKLNIILVSFGFNIEL